MAFIIFNFFGEETKLGVGPRATCLPGVAL